MPFDSSDKVVGHAQAEVPKAVPFNQITRSHHCTVEQFA